MRWLSWNASLSISASICKVTLQIEALENNPLCNFPAYSSQQLRLNVQLFRRWFGRVPSLQFHDWIVQFLDRNTEVDPSDWIVQSRF